MSDLIPKLIFVAFLVAVSIWFRAVVGVVRSVNPTLGSRLSVLGWRGTLGFLALGACELYFLIAIVRGPEVADRMSNLILLIIFGVVGALWWSQWKKL